jgi:competence protein ComEA
MISHSSHHGDERPQNFILQDPITQYRTIPYTSALPPASFPVPLSDQPTISMTAEQDEHSMPAKKTRITRIFAVSIALVLLIMLYFTWRSASPPTSTAGITQQNFASTTATPMATSNANTGDADNGSIQAYIVGAVKQPGVYKLEPNARIYELLNKAGGPLPDANLLALNLAAKVNDGQEVYVPRIGETPPAYARTASNSGATTDNTVNGSSAGPLVNINTASASEMQQSLHIRSTTAQNIVTYRTQHGPFTSIDQLLQVISKTTYDKIKGMITV